MTKRFGVFQERGGPHRIATPQACRRAASEYTRTPGIAVAFASVGSMSSDAKSMLVYWKWLARDLTTSASRAVPLVHTDVDSQKQRRSAVVSAARWSAG